MALLAKIDPVRSGEEFAPFPFDKLQLRSIAPGDRVEIVADLESVPDNEVHHSGGYRDAARSVLVPTGPVKLRLG